MAILELKQISKDFSGSPAIHSVDLSLKRDQVLCLLGPSGCGKTTLLRIIAGLETPDKGTVLFGGRNMAKVSPHRRKFRMMFQDFALFPHKSVFENVAFGLEMQGLARKAIDVRVSQMLALVGLKGFGSRAVNQLSGGERQRVALARSLAPDPGLLLLDEPLGSLDLALRQRLLFDLKGILAEIGVPTIFVTHDQSEAFAIAHRIAVMDRGKILQIAAPEQLYREPISAGVATFLGFRNLVAGRFGDDGLFTCPLGSFQPLWNSANEPGEAVLLIRPEAARLTERGQKLTPETATIEGRVVEWLFQGTHYRLRLEAPTGQSLIFELPNHTPPPERGRMVTLAIDPAGMVILKAD